MLERSRTRPRRGRRVCRRSRGLRTRHLPAVGGAGPGDPRPAAAPPDRSRAGQDRSTNTASCIDDDPGICSTSSRAPARLHERDPRRADRNCASSYADERRTRDRAMNSRPDGRGPDHAAGRRRDAVARGLREGAAGQRLPGAAARRARQVPRTRVKDEDFIDKLFVANTHDTLLCFTSRGKVYWLKVVPAAAGGARRARHA